MCELEKWDSDSWPDTGRSFPSLYLMTWNQLSQDIPSRMPENTELLLRVHWIPSSFHFPGLDMDFLLICEDRLNPCYFCLHSGTEALSWSQENNPAATIQWSKSLVCRDQESKALTLGETIREEKITAHSPCPKFHTYRGSSTGTPWWSTRTKKTGTQTKHLLSSGFSTEQSHLKAQKNNQDPQSRKQKCAIQNHTDVNLTFKGLYITKTISHNECVKSIQSGSFPVC